MPSKSYFQKPNIFKYYYNTFWFDTYIYMIIMCQYNSNYIIPISISWQLANIILSIGELSAYTKWLCANNHFLFVFHRFYLFILFYIVLVEELLCLATWKDGSTKYMIGKLEHTPTSSDEDKYRCFVVGKSIGGSFEMAQSGDATCNGMSSPTDGSRTMKFNRGKQE